MHFPVFTNLDYIIKEEEVLKAIKGLKKNKSPGLDNIISEFIIYGKYDLVKSICKLFNLVFRTTSYPKIWTVSYLKPVHKKDIITHLEGQTYVWHGCKWNFAGPQIYLQPAKIKSQYFGVSLKFLVCN